MGGGGSSGPTVQQQQLQTQQALTTANLNLEENSQRKVILNSMQGTRAFRGSALSRGLDGNNDAQPAAAPAPSTGQDINTYGQITTTPTASLLDQAARGQSSAGGAGASGNALAGRSGGVAAIGSAAKGAAFK
jgi:hypothetical protein